MKAELVPLLAGPAGRWAGALLLLLVVVLGTWVRPVAETPEPVTTVTPVVSEAPAPQPTPPPSVGVVAAYREAVVGAPTTLNPLLASQEAELDAVRLLFAGLTRADGRGGVEPDLAERWTIGEDGKVYTFMLRAGALWHDDQPVTSRDVLFTVRLMQEASLPANRVTASLWRTIQVDLVDARTVRFTLSEPNTPFLTRTTFPLLPAHLLHGVYPGDLARHEFGRRPVGAGPYRTVEGLRETDMLLERAERYHGPRPGIDRVLLRFYPDLDTALTALQQGGVDGLAGLPAARLAEIKARPGLRVHAAPLNGYTALLLNLRRPIFQQREVRQAVALAVDRAEVVDEALAGAGAPLAGPIVASSWAFAAPTASPSPDQARALLDRSGWSPRPGDGVREREGRPLALTVLTTDSPERLRAATVVARQLGQVGIGVTVIPLPAAELVSRYLVPRDFEVALFGWAGLGDDPDPYGLWHSSQAEQGFNFAGWSLPRADELLEAGRLARDQATRQLRYAEFQQVFADEAPSVILYTPHYLLVTAERVKVVDLGPINRPADRFRAIVRWTVEVEQAVG